MKTDQLVRLAASGNIKDVEEAWLRLLDRSAGAEVWRDRAAVLKALADKNNSGEAETLATTALESISESGGPEDALSAASDFLRAVKGSNTLRTTVAELYRTVYADAEGLESLMAEAGVEGGRPPRRALRTMEVCLQLQEGLCLTHRHEDSAVRVENLDRDSWTIDVSDGRKTETLGAVELADNYAPAPEDDFQVMARFEGERLAERLKKDPGGIVESILRSNGSEISSDELKLMLVPKHVSSRDWTKWWTKARQSLRENRHVAIDGRSPYYLKYDPTTLTLEEEAEADLAKAHDPVRELAIIDRYLKDCKAHKHELDNELLKRARERILQRRERMEQNGAKLELLPYLIAQRIGLLYEDEQATATVVAALQRAPDPAEAILAVTDPTYWPAACSALEESHPTDLVGALKKLLPHAPIRVADTLAEHLIELGEGHETFRELADQILREPVRLNEGLVWLWNGPSPEAARVAVPLATILTRLLSALGEVQRGGELFTRDRVRTIAGNSRDVIKARNFARFREMLEHIEPGVAAALRTQIGRLDNLARTAEDMQKLLREKFPQLTTVAPTLPKWLQDDALYATEAGYNKRHAEMDELVNVKIRENAIAIGNAAERGDLSENSEYKFALEERDLLQARLAQMQREMDAYRPLRPEDIPADHVGIGCRIVLKHSETGATQEITLLGPWESNQDLRIYNYRTPLAQSILGTKVGDVAEVEFFDPPGEYRVLEVNSALEKASTSV